MNANRPGRLCRGPAMLAATLLLAACADPGPLDPHRAADSVPTPAFELISSSHNEIAGTFFNTCTQEPMAFHGVMHVVVTQTSDAAGGEHYHLRYTFGPAFNVGLITGTVYQAQSNFSYMESTLPSGVYQLTVIRNRPFSGHGAEPDWDLHYDVHITVLPDGITVSDPENLFVTCR